MAEATKNLCAHIPVSLHQKVSDIKDKSGQNMNQCVTAILTEYFEMKEGGVKNMEAMKNLVAQIPADLFDQIDEITKKKGISKKKFVTAALRVAVDSALAEMAESAETNGQNDTE